MGVTSLFSEDDDKGHWVEDPPPPPPPTEVRRLLASPEPMATKNYPSPALPEEPPGHTQEYADDTVGIKILTGAGGLEGKKKALFKDDAAPPRKVAAAPPPPPPEDLTLFLPAGAAPFETPRRARADTEDSEDPRFRLRVPSVEDADVAEALVAGGGVAGAADRGAAVDFLDAALPADADLDIAAAFEEVSDDDDDDGGRNQTEIVFEDVFDETAQEDPRPPPPPPPRTPPRRGPGKHGSPGASPGGLLALFRPSNLWVRNRTTSLSTDSVEDSLRRASHMRGDDDVELAALDTAE